MPLYMGIHYNIEGLIVDAIMHAHEADRTPHNFVPMWKLSRSGILFKEALWFTPHHASEKKKRSMRVYNPLQRMDASPLCP